MVDQLSHRLDLDIEGRIGDLGQLVTGLEDGHIRGSDRLSLGLFEQSTQAASSLDPSRQRHEPIPWPKVHEANEDPLPPPPSPEKQFHLF